MLFHTAGSILSHQDDLGIFMPNITSLGSLVAIPIPFPQKLCSFAETQGTAHQLSRNPGSPPQRAVFSFSGTLREAALLHCDNLEIGRAKPGASGLRPPPGALLQRAASSFLGTLRGAALLHCNETRD